MRKCPACNAVIENERAKFCKKCGARLAPEVSLSNDEENTHVFSPNNGVDPHDDDDVAVVGHSRGGIPLTGMSSAGNAGVEKDEEGHNVHFHKPKPYNRFTPNDEPQYREYTASKSQTSSSRGMLWAVKKCFKNYATFNGRASRSEYWYFYLFNFIIVNVLSIATVIVDEESASAFFLILWVLYSFITFLPSLAALTRRLHDVGKGGQNIFLLLVPIIGPVIIIMDLCKEGESGKNRFGRPTKS